MHIDQAHKIRFKFHAPLSSGLLYKKQTVNPCSESIRKSVSLVVLVVFLVLVVLIVFLVLIVLIISLILVVLIVVLFVVLVVSLVLIVILVIHDFTSLIIFKDSLSQMRQTIHNSKNRKETNMLLIKNGLLHTMEDNTPTHADLLIKKGKIKKISKNIIPDEDTEIFDAQNLNVYPGFIDAHSHLGIAEEKTTTQNDTSNENTFPTTPTVRGIDCINPMDSAFHNALAAGITGVMAGPGSSNAIGGQFAFIKTYGRRIDDMIVLAPSAIKIALGENPINCYGINGNTPATRMGTASLIREELFKAQQYLSQDSSDAKDFYFECYRELFEKKIPLKAHAHRADDIFTAIRIAKEFNLDLTIDHCTEGHLIAQEIAESGFPAIVGPSLASRNKKEVGLCDFKTAGILHDSGVTVAITTDHPVSRIQYLPLCAALAAKEGLGETAALRAITIDAARICRVDGRLGSLKEGKDADIVIYEGNPLEINSSVKATIINGNIVWQSEKS